jgi:hypothetical protein
MTLKSQLAKTAYDVMFNQNEFGELCDYDNSFTTKYDVRCLAIRKHKEGGTGQKYETYVVEVYIANSDTYGMDEVAPGRDRVRISDQAGGSPGWKRVAKVLSSSADVWHLRLEG